MLPLLMQVVHCHLVVCSSQCCDECQFSPTRLSFCHSLSLSLSPFLMCLKWAEVSWEETGPLQSSLAEDKIMLPTVGHRQLHQYCCSYILCRCTHCAMNVQFLLWKIYKICPKKTGKTECTLMGTKCCISFEKCTELAVLWPAAVVHLCYLSLYQPRQLSRDWQPIQLETSDVRKFCDFQLQPSNSLSCFFCLFSFLQWQIYTATTKPWQQCLVWHTAASNFIIDESTKSLFYEPITCL